jgi:hypothetical protein
MNFKTTYVLFGILVALLLAFFLTQVFSTKPGEENYLLADLHRAGVTADNIDTVEIQRNRPKEEKIVLVLDRSNKRWRMTEPYPARADSDVVNRLVRDLISAKRDDKANVADNPAKYGLEPPAETVTLKDGANHEWSVRLGDESTGGTSNAVVYVVPSGKSERPTAVKKTEIDSVQKELGDLRSKDLLADSGDFGGDSRVQTIQLQDTGKQTFVLDKDAEERWRFKKPDFGEADYEGEAAPAAGDSKPITGVRQLITDLDNLKVPGNADFVANNVPDFAKYGLQAEKPERLRIEVTRKPPSSSGEGASKEPEHRVLLIGKKADEKGDQLYARLESESNIVRIPAKGIDAILQVAANPAVLRNRDLVQVDANRADAIDVQSTAGMVKLRKPQAVWQIQDAGKWRNAETQTVQDLLSALNTKRQVQAFPDPAKQGAMGFDKPSAVVSIWVDGLQKEEKKDEKKESKAAESKKPDGKEKQAAGDPKLKDAKPTAKLTFGNKDGANVYVLRETAAGKAVFEVPDTLMAKLDQGSLAYVDRTLPSFSESADVTSLAVERGGETFDVDKEQKDEKTPATWKLKEPKDLAGRMADTSAVNRMIAELRGLRTDKLVVENPPTTALSQYGLDKPAIRATVRVLNKENKKTEDWVYSFGSEAPDKSGRYARMSKGDFVFLAPSNIVEVLNGELQEPTVFHFDAAKVKALKLSGWKQAAGYTFTLSVERKGDSSWAVKSPPDFDLDSEQIDSLLQNLGNLRAQRFVARKGGPKPEYKLSPTDRVLQIEIVLESEKTPLTLSLGAQDTKEKAYFAESSTLPGAVFLIAAAPFDKILSSPKSLAKSPPAKQ